MMMCDALQCGDVFIPTLRGRGRGTRSGKTNYRVRVQSVDTFRVTVEPEQVWEEDECKDDTNDDAVRYS